MGAFRTWKKVFESDLMNIINEMKEVMNVPCVIFLDGPVGAGKTTFTRNFIEKADVQSPTYSIINEYDSILHADLYRIEKKDDLIHLEIPMYIEEKEYFLIEWGMPYRTQIQRLVGDEFSYYQLKIDINESIDSKPSSRNFSLEKI
jgi:tRNA threonylcarbamoyladenosine biosynthesis protein TsaE